MGVFVVNVLKNKIKNTFNAFDGKNLENLDDFYADSVAFEDPVTKIKGLKNLKKYYSHAYKNVKSIKFEFSEIFNEGGTYGAAWEMHLSVKGLNGGREYTVPGFSRIKFNKKNLVIEHRDYVDLGDMVYERLPLQGLVISLIKKMLTK